MKGETIELLAQHHPGDEMMPYERLIGEALLGDQTLFVREDGVEAAWRVVDPILDDTTPVHIYNPGTWGPAEANTLITRHDGEWQALQKKNQRP